LRLQFPTSEISVLARRYVDGRERGALIAGRAIAGGDCTQARLRIIYVWKTRNMRGMVRLLDKNTDEEIADALRLAVSAKTERGAMASLMGLEGVNVAVASAVMTAIRPRRYTVIDFRALHSLGVENRNGLSLGFYLEYLEFCRSLAKEQGVTLRELDRALWRWSKENP